MSYPVLIVQEYTATSWTLIRSAAEGKDSARADFARRYSPVVRAFIATLWKASSLAAEADDAIEDVLFECMKDGGALEHARFERRGGFRAFLYGIARNVTARYERRRATSARRESQEKGPSDEIGGAVGDAARAFDRAWAIAVMKTATEAHRTAAIGDPRKELRVRLLEAIFRDGRTVRDWAAVENLDAAFLHHEYATARREFSSILRAVVADELSLEKGSSEVTEECRGLLSLLEE